MSKDALKRAIILGVAGVTAINSVPNADLLVSGLVNRVSAMSIEFSEDLKDYTTDVNGESVTFHMKNTASCRYIKSSKKILFEYYNMAVSYKMGKSNFGVSGNALVQGGLDLVFNKTDVTFGEFIRNSYPDVESIVFLKSTDKPVLSENSVDYSGDFIADYFTGKKITYHLDYTTYKDLSFDEYVFKAYFNGVEVPKSSYKDNGNGTLDVEVDLTNSIYWENDTAEGDIPFKATLNDGITKEAIYETSVKVDRVTPSVSEGAAKYVTGTDDKTYFDTLEDGSLELSFEVSDGASGVGSVKVYVGSDEYMATNTGSNQYKVVIPSSEGGVKPNIVVVDKSGNSKEYSVSDIYKGSNDTVYFGLPEPSFSLESSGGDEKDGWFIGSNIKLDIGVTNDIGGLTKVKYLVNGSEKSLESVSGTSFKGTLDLDENVSESGKVSVVVVAYDGNGNEFRSNAFEMSIDNVEPSIEGISVPNSDKYNVYDGVAYLGESVEIEGLVKDLESGVSKVEVFLDGELVGTSLPFSGNGSGKYTVKVTDKVGHFKEYSLEDIVGKDFESVYVSSLSPSISVTPFAEDGVYVDGVPWYKGLSSLYFSVESDNLKDIEVSLYSVDRKEETLVKSLEWELEEGKGNRISLEDIEDGNYKIEIVAKNKTGKKASSTVLFGIDSIKPRVTEGKITGIYSNGGNNYFKDEATLLISAEDGHSGLSKYQLLNAGGEVVSEVNGSSQISFQVRESGEYFIKVMDNMGNEETYGLGTISGVDSNLLTKDDKAPTIEYSLPSLGKGELGNIFGREISSSVDVLDSVSGVKSVEILLNGVKVSESINFVLDTSKYESEANGLYRVSVRAEDNVGNISNLEYSFYVDREAPSIGSISMTEGYNDECGFLWFREKASINIEASDSLVKVSEYIILNKDGSERKSRTQMSNLLSGDYAVKVVDEFGNTSRVYAFEEILKSEGSEVVIDEKSPEIVVDRPEGKVGNWYTDDVNYSFTVDDIESLKDVEVLINGESVKTYTSKIEEGRPEKSINGDFSTSLGKSNDCSYVVEIVARDYSGNMSTFKETVNVDKESPYFIDSRVSEKYEEKDFGVYFKSKPVINVSGKDDGIGVGKYLLLDKKGSVIKTNDTGEFELTGHDEYSVAIEDKLGRSVVKTVKDLLGLTSNYIVVDSEKPSISVKIPEGAVGNWYSDDVVYGITVSDNESICSAEVRINGKTVETYQCVDGLNKRLSLSADTSKVEAQKDGSYDIEVVTSDNAGNSDKWGTTVYIDREAPVIEKFVITAKGYKEGKNIDGSGNYGFYLKGATDVEVYVSDGDVSSGMDEVRYTLSGANGGIMTESVKIVNGVATIRIPKNFKGFLSAYAVDMVGNKGRSEKPDGIISEDGNVHVNTSKISMNLPKTEFKDSKGNNLYNGDISIDLGVSNETSGIRKIEWGINGETIDTIDVDNKGDITGSVSKVNIKDRNLVISLNKELKVANNENSLKVWVKTTDRVGHVSESDRVVSIDRDTPIINVTYGETLKSGYYDSNRVATVEIKERNFEPSKVEFKGTYGKVGEWVNKEGDTWVTDVVFSKDGEYQWGINYTDMAGNKASGYNSEKFTVDKTAPVLGVSFDNNDFENKNYYKKGRTATIKIVEKNFDAKLVKLTGNGEISGWSHDGDNHTAKIVFDSNGEYNFSVGMKDLSGNTSKVFDSGKFIIDMGKPKVSVVGVQDGVSYKKGVTFRVSFSDKYLDFSRCVAVLEGRTNGKIKLEGSLNSETGEYVFKGLPKELKYDDLYSLSVTVYDKAGNVSKENLSFSINRFGSQYKFLNEHLLGNMVNAAEDVELEEITVDRLDMGSCKVVVIKDGNTVEVDSSLITITESGGEDGPWIYKYHIDKKAFSEDGKYQVQVFSKAKDGSDNSSLVQEYAFLLDTLKPEIIVSGIENGVFYKGVTRKVSIDVRDLSGVESIEVLLNEKPVELFEGDGIYTFSITESNADQSVKVKVTDKAGNSSELEIIDFMVSSSVVQSVIHSDWFKWVVGGFTGILALFLLLKSRKKEDTEKDSKSLEEK